MTIFRLEVMNTYALYSRLKVIAWKDKVIFMSFISEYSIFKLGPVDRSIRTINRKISEKPKRIGLVAG